MTYLLDFSGLGCRHVIPSRGPCSACNPASAPHNCVLSGTHCTCQCLLLFPSVFFGFFGQLLLFEGACSLYQRSNLCLAIKLHAFPACHGPIRDTGASAHFTNRKSDFISYQPYLQSDMQPVRTAAHMIFVEGSGTVLLWHYVNKTLVTTRVHPVLYIPSMSICLLSMGEFLQQGMGVLGNLLHITLLHQKLFVQCKPGHTLYWLDAASTTVEVQFIKTPYIYKVDYDLMHCCLGHPSKEVLRHAKENTKGFPNGIKIPNTSKDVCPGCVQGKMPAALHPPSITRATTPFKRIHSDLKSFPLLSYAKYKYFIVFLDNYTSYAWITLLRDKASAITALRQWLALIKNQFDTTIKEWMSNASSEYKSDVFLKTLKDAGITVLQSMPHMPQQNGCAEHFMHTIHIMVSHGLCN
jgi:hypothetical protein